jgi:hypothetical protein
VNKWCVIAYNEVSGETQINNIGAMSPMAAASQTVQDMAAKIGVAKRFIKVIAVVGGAHRSFIDHIAQGKAMDGEQVVKKYQELQESHAKAAERKGRTLCSATGC